MGSEVRIKRCLDLGLNPWVGQGLNCRQTSVNILGHQLLDQVFSAITDVSPSVALERPHALLYFGNDVFFGGSIERRSAAEHDIQDDTDTPHVTLLSVCAYEHLRSDVVRCTIHLMHHMRAVVVVMGGAEVNDLDRATILHIKEDILWFQISMCNILTMAVGNSLQDLLANMSGFVLSQMLTLGDLIEQLAAFTQLRDQEYRAFILVDLKETHNIRVSEILEDVNFVH